MMQLMLAPPLSVKDSHQILVLLLLLLLLLKVLQPVPRDQGAAAQLQLPGLV